MTRVLFTWERRPSQPAAEAAAAARVARGPGPARRRTAAEVGVLVTGDDARCRTPQPRLAGQVDTATDVLSFPDGDRAADRGHLLGDDRRSPSTPRAGRRRSSATASCASWRSCCCTASSTCWATTTRGTRGEMDGARARACAGAGRDERRPGRVVDPPGDRAASRRRRGAALPVTSSCCCAASPRLGNVRFQGIARGPRRSCCPVPAGGEPPPVPAARRPALAPGRACVGLLAGGAVHASALGRAAWRWRVGVCLPAGAASLVVAAGRSARSARTRVAVAAPRCCGRWSGRSLALVARFDAARRSRRRRRTTRRRRRASGRSRRTSRRARRPASSSARTPSCSRRWSTSSTPWCAR